MYQVIKRDRKVTDFNIKKISKAIEKAFISQNRIYDNSVIDMLALKVTSHFENKIYDHKIAVEDIQDSVEDILSQSGYSDVAKAYILYRRQREKARSMKYTITKYKTMLDNYVDNKEEPKSDSIGCIILNNNGRLTKNYWFSEIYDDEIVNAHKNGSFYIHSLNRITPERYCLSLKEIVVKGLKDKHHKIFYAPAKHLWEICDQLAAFYTLMQYEWSQELILTSIDTYLAPFIRMDQLGEDRIRESLSSLIDVLNLPTREGVECPQSYFMFDWNVPQKVKNEKVFLGDYQDFTYGDCEKEQEQINRLFLEIMLEKEKTYPISIYNQKALDSHEENQQLLMTLIGKTGIPFFSRLDSIECSVGRISINVARLAYLSKNEADFMNRFNHLMDIAARGLNIKREIIDKFFNQELYPLSRYFHKKKESCCSIALAGIDHLAMNIEWLKEEEIHDFTIKIIKYALSKAKDYRKIYEYNYLVEGHTNQEASLRFYRKDKEKYPNMKNSYCSKIVNEDLLQRLDKEEDYACLLEHAVEISIKENYLQWKSLRSFIEKVMDNYHFSIVKIKNEERSL